METLSILLFVCAGKLQITGGCIHKGPVMRSFDVSFHASMMKLLKKQSQSVDDMRRHVLGNVKQKRDKVVNICFLCQTYIILSVKARACYSRLMSCHATHKLVSAAPLPYIHISYLVTSVTRETLTSICQKYLRMWPYNTANPYIFEDNN